MTEKAVIVGAGMVGLATAYRLARDGLDVTVVDTGRSGAYASTRNAGWIVPVMSTPVPAPGMVGKALRWMARKDSPLHIRPSLRPDHVRFMASMLRHCNSRDYQHGIEALAALNERTVSLFDGYQQDGVRFEYHRTGHLLVFRTRDAMHAHRADFAPMERIGHTAVPLSGDEVRDLEPALGPYVQAGLQCTQERHVDPATLIEGLEQRCRDLGVRFLHGRHVTGIRSEAALTTSVLAGDEEISGDLFVLAAGVHSGALSRLAGFPLPIQPGKGYGFDDTSGSVKLRHSVYLGEAKVALTPLSGLPGSPERWSSAAPTPGSHHIVCAESSSPCGEYLPDFPPAQQQAWTGLRPMTPDGLPVIGPLPGKENVFVASGHGMLGVTLAPMTAEIIAAQVKGEERDSDIANTARPFSPQRFARRGHGKTVR